MIRIAREASEVLRARSDKDFSVDYKGKDDPVTTLDREVNTLVCDALAREYPHVPIVAEEGEASSWEVRKTAPEVFFVDPVDGTRELIAKNGQFCVMIGLAREGRPVGGVVAWPAHNRIFAAWENAAFEIDQDGARKTLRCVDVDSIHDARIVVSRSHPDPETRALLDRLGVKEQLAFGSTGLKVALVASGQVQGYVHAVTRGGGKLWDACGPEAIARAAGARFTDASGRPIDYRGNLALDAGLVVAAPDVHRALLAALRN